MVLPIFFFLVRRVYLAHLGGSVLRSVWVKHPYIKKCSFKLSTPESGGTNAVADLSKIIGGSRFFHFALWSSRLLEHSEIILFLTSSEKSFALLIYLVALMSLHSVFSEIDL